MKNSHTRIHALLTTAAAMAAFAAPAAQAHGIWFAQRATQLALIYGVGADDLDSVKRQGLVEHIAGYDEDYNPIPTRLRVAGPLLLVDSDAPPIVVAAVLQNGIWSKRPDGEWVKKGKDEVPDAVQSEKTIKYAVRINGALGKPLPPLPQQTLQIVPVDAQLPEKAGTPIRLKVLFQGKPVAGAEVQSDYVNDPDQKPFVTKKDGLATLKVRNQGLNVVAVTYVGPPDEPAKINRVEYRATLSFVLPHAPE